MHPSKTNPRGNRTPSTFPLHTSISGIIGLDGLDMTLYPIHPTRSWALIQQIQWISKTGIGSHVYAPSWRHMGRLPYRCRCHEYAPGASDSNCLPAQSCVATLDRSIDLTCHCLAITVLETYVCYGGIAEERSTSKDSWWTR